MKLNSNRREEMKAEPAEKKPGGREITYQIGWKKGTIVLRHLPAAPQLESGKMKLLGQYIWKPAAFIPAQVAFIVLCLLPILSFGCILWLIHSLASIKL